jgi:hypothetical protein
MSKDAYYFPHDANARRDKKILLMLSKYKMGYQWYFMTVEVLREEKEYKYPLDMLPALAQELYVDIDTMKQFIKDCIKVFRLFDSDKKYFWSESLNSRMQPMEERRNQNRENVAKRWKKQTKEGIKEDTTVIQPYNDSSTVVMQSKGKERKGEESKENDIGSESEKVIWENLSPPYTIEECISTAEYEGYKKEEGEKFYNHYSAQGWKRGTAGLLITDLVSAFRSWIDKGKEGNKKLAKETWEDKQRKKSI